MNNINLHGQKFKEVDVTTADGKVVKFKVYKFTAWDGAVLVDCAEGVLNPKMALLKAGGVTNIDKERMDEARLLACSYIQESSSGMVLDDIKMINFHIPDGNTLLTLLGELYKFNSGPLDGSETSSKDSNPPQQ